MTNKKTIYHSNLTSPTRISVESDAMKSKWADKNGLKPNDPGYYYLFIKVDGEDKILTAENQYVAKALEAFKGKGEITVQAEGRDEQAVMNVLHSDGTKEVAHPPTQEQKTEQKEAQKANGLGEFQAQLRRMSDAMLEIKRAVKAEQDQAEKELGIKSSPEDFHAEVTTFFINLNPSRRDIDYIGNLPTI